MARQRSLILLVWLLLALSSGKFVRADATPVPIGRRPYAIRAHVSFDAPTRVDATLREIILADWLALVERFVGPPWAVDAVSITPTLATLTLDSVAADELKPLAAGVDKVWIVRVGRFGASFTLEGREFDSLTGQLGEIHRADVRDAIDLPRGLLTLARSLFEPIAEVGEQRAGGVTFEVQGGAITVSNPVGAVAPVGTIFRAVRLFLEPDGKVSQVLDIPYSYFRVEERIGSVASCAIIKGVGDPLTSRYSRKNRIVALGVQPARAPTRLRFLLKADRVPAAGFKLTARTAEENSKAYEVGITDRDGRVELPVDFARELVIVRVIGGSDEPLADVPIMPGETRSERTIILDGRPRTLDLEAKLDALRDAIIDTVASRSRLEARMKARLEGDDLAGFDDSLALFRKLTPRDLFDARLHRLQAEGEQAEASTKTLVLTRNARALIDETQGLITRYLDDEIVKGLIDTADSARAEQAANALSKKKGATPKK